MRPWIAATLFAIPSANAQQATPSELRTALEQLQTTRIQLSVGGERVVGNMQRVAGDTLYVAPESVQFAFPLSSVDTLWPRGDASRRGTIGGAVAGGLLLGFSAMVGYGLAGAEGGSTNDVRASHLAVGAVGAAIGAGLGALVGGMIGSRVTSWRRVYPGVRR